MISQPRFAVIISFSQGQAGFVGETASDAVTEALVYLKKFIEPSIDFPTMRDPKKLERYCRKSLPVHISQAFEAKKLTNGAYDFRLPPEILREIAEARRCRT